ncbi:MAG: pyridoxamine 5'-phosphate oxidase family protein [Sediminibacterium sp.]
MGDLKNLVNTEAIEKIKELATSADICMFTTSLSKLPLTARPMSTVDVDDEANIWFISMKSSNKNAEISADKRVQLFYASRNSSEYLSVYGEASIIIDKELFKDKWVVEAKAWLEEGVDDPEMSLIKVTSVDSYYWDTKHNKYIALIKMATAIITGNAGDDDGVEGSVTV